MKKTLLILAALPFAAACSKKVTLEQPSVTSSFCNYEVFVSQATNLVTPAVSGVDFQVYLKNVESNEIKLISRAPNGDPSNDDAITAVISGNCKYVVYETYADDIVAGDSNNNNDIFRYEIATGNTVLVSLSTDGNQGGAGASEPSVSDDGNIVSFRSSSSSFVSSDANVTDDVFVRNVSAGTTVLASAKADNTNLSSSSRAGLVSGDGKFVAFVTAGQYDAADTNSDSDVYRKNLQTGELELVSVDVTGNAAVSIDSSRIGMSADGRYIAFVADIDITPDDTNTDPDIYRRDMNSKELKRMSVLADGSDFAYSAGFPQGGLSRDGSSVILQSHETISASSVTTFAPSGAYYVKNIDTGVMLKVADMPDGTIGDMYEARFSADGTAVVFSAYDAFLSKDTNTENDIYFKRFGQDLKRISESASGNEADAGSWLFGAI